MPDTGFPDLTNRREEGCKTGYKGDFVEKLDANLRPYAANLGGLKVLALSIRKCKDLKDNQIKDSVRYAWCLNKSRALNANLLLACHGGVIVGAYDIPDDEFWKRATRSQFRELDHAKDQPNKWGWPIEALSNHKKRSSLLWRRFTKTFDRHGRRYLNC